MSYVNVKGCCPETSCRPDPCGCKFFIDTKCVIYDGRGFRTIDLPKGSNLESLLEWIDNKLYEIVNDVLPLRNVGDGLKIFKGRTLDNFYEFRTLKSANENALVLTEVGDTIVLEGFVPTLERDGNKVKLVLTNSKSSYVVSTINLETSQDVYISEVAIENNNLVFRYNREKPPLTINISSFLSDFYGVELTLVGTKLNLVRNGALSALSVDLRSLKDDIDTYTTNLRLDGSVVVLSQKDKDDIRLDLASLGSGGVDTFVESFVMEGNVLKLKQNNGKGEFSIDLSRFIFTADKHLTSVEFDSRTYVLTLKRSQGLPDLEVDLSAFKPVQSDLIQNDSTKSDFIKNKNFYKEITSNYTLTPEDNNTELFINNGSSNITITVPDKAPMTVSLEHNNSYFVSLTQIGTGEVTISGCEVVPDGFKNVIRGKGHVAAVTITPFASVLQGNLKPA